MDKIRYRDLQRWGIEDVLRILPASVTRDSQATMVILTTEDYNKLVQMASSRQDSQATTSLPPVFINTKIHPPGTLVRMRQGKRMIEVIVPEVDADGYVIYE